ncbi:MAG: hypothetical protein JNL73_19945 [Anaerolineales bacterium]|nr:hypothetical protein [Anaerolineales bacterium]
MFPFRHLRLLLALAFVLQLIAPFAPQAIGADDTPIVFGNEPNTALSLATVTPNGRYWLFCTAPNSGTGPRTLISVDAATKVGVKLFETTESFCANYQRVFAPADFRNYFFLARSSSTTGWELKRAALDGSQPTQSVSGQPPAGYEVLVIYMSPDKRWIVYDIRHIASGMNYIERQLGLYIVPTDGSAPPRQLPIQPADPAKYVLGQGFTPDSATFLYVSDQDGAAYQWNLYAVAIDGQSAPRRLTPQPCADYALSYYECHGLITRDLQFSYLSLNTTNATGLYRVPLNSSAPTWQFVRNTRGEQLVLNDTRILAYTNTNITTMPVDGSSAPQDAVAPLPAGAQGAYRTPGSGPTPVTACAGACMIVPWVGVSTNSQWLYRVALDGATPAQQLAAVPGAGNSGTYRITWVVLSRDGTRVFFEVGNDNSTLVELYVVPVDGSASAHRIASWAATPSPGMMLWAPLSDGRYVAVVDLTLDPHVLQVVDSTLVDGPRLPGPSVGFLGRITAVSPNGREIMVSGLAGWFLVDALTPVLPERLHLPSLRR